jgi:hypothetical protein
VAQGSKKECFNTQKGNFWFLKIWTPELTSCHFHCILSVKAIAEATPIQKQSNTKFNLSMGEVQRNYSNLESMTQSINASFQYGGI